jgi:carbonic anhydrase/acetyltransferase-like protein (isoleucine patch superfamily)
VGAGHNSVLHACTLEDEAFVGMGATILDGAVVEKGAMVAAGALITQNTRVPSGQVQFFQLISILMFNSIYL